MGHGIRIRRTYEKNVFKAGRTNFFLKAGRTKAFLKAGRMKFLLKAGRTKRNFAGRTKTFFERNGVNQVCINSHPQCIEANHSQGNDVENIRFGNCREEAVLGIEVGHIIHLISFVFYQNAKRKTATATAIQP